MERKSGERNAVFREGCADFERKSRTRRLYLRLCRTPWSKLQAYLLLMTISHFSNHSLRFCGDADFQVHAFSTASSFRQFYRREMPGCLVLDTRMPRQDGLDFYKQLLREGYRLPVIFISTQADVPMAVAAMKSGAIEFLEKPIDYDSLLVHVQQALALDAEWRKRDTAYAASGYTNSST